MSRRFRVCIIIHLCLALTYLTYLVLQPSLKGMLVKKSETLIFESVINHKPQFDTLPEEQRQRIIEEMGHLPHTQLPTHISRFGLVWLTLSVMVFFLLLFDIKGAGISALLIPITVIAAGVFEKRSYLDEKDSLFPTEEYVIEHYIEPHETFKHKRERLIEGWNRYLIKEWGHKPIVKVARHNEQAHLDQAQLEQAHLDLGQFAFNVERVERLIAQKGVDPSLQLLFYTPHPYFYLLFLLWNLVFAWQMNRRSFYNRASSAHSNSLA